MSDLERIGKLILYRNKILEKILRELQKEFPDMDILLEEFVRLLEAIDDLDNDVIATIARLKEMKPIEIKKEVVEENAAKETEAMDQIQREINLDEWVLSVVNSINGSDSARNYVLQLKKFNGIAFTSQLVKALGVDKSTVTIIEKNLESKGVIKSIILPNKQKIVYFNHPDILKTTIDRLQSILNKAVERAVG